MFVKEYRSSIAPDLRLTAEFYVPEVPKPLCLFFHGWNMTAADSAFAGYIAFLTRDFFVVNVDMRGRGGSAGNPDASGFELIDGLDALDYARATWPEMVEAGERCVLVGGSGGGGNALALAGKAPDLFSSAVAWAAMSDYALWYERDTNARYRGKMEEWIGGDPESNPDGYRSRGGLHLVENVLTNLLVIHGKKDEAVPPCHAERYAARARELGKRNIRVYFNDKGHASEEWPMMLEHLRASETPRRLAAAGTLKAHSFLACRAFRLVLDHPSRMAAVTYNLDKEGRFSALQFHQEKDAEPVKNVRLRIPGPVHCVTVEQGQRIFTLQGIFARPGLPDFQWDCKGAWRATAEW